MRRGIIIRFVIGFVLFTTLYYFIISGAYAAKRLEMSLFWGLLMAAFTTLLQKPFTKLIIRSIYGKKHLDKLEEKGEFDKW